MKKIFFLLFLMPFIAQSQAPSCEVIYRTQKTDIDSCHFRIVVSDASYIRGYSKWTSFNICGEKIYVSDDCREVRTNLPESKYNEYSNIIYETECLGIDSVYSILYEQCDTLRRNKKTQTEIYWLIVINLDVTKIGGNKDTLNVNRQIFSPQMYILYPYKYYDFLNEDHNKYLKKFIDSYTESIKKYFSRAKNC